MSKRFLATLMLVAVLAIAAAAVWLNRRPSPMPEPQVFSQPSAEAHAPSTPSASAATSPEPGDDVLLQAANPPEQKVPKTRVSTKADEPAAREREPLALELPPDFLNRIVDAAGRTVSFALPGGQSASGTVELLRRDARGVRLVQGRISTPLPGAFIFQRQTAAGTAGTLVGNVRFDSSKLGFRVDPRGAGGAPVLVERRLDQIICEIPEPDLRRVTAAQGPQNAPQTHPTNIPIPDYQNGVVPLESLPGALGVIYLDFDGERGPFSSWGNFDAAPSGATNGEIKEVWQRVSEDFQEFDLNVTTDRRTFDQAPETSRMHVMVSPTNTAAPGAGGVAFIGSFNWSGDTVCWAFYTTGKSAAEVISHEVGHTLGLSHDGRRSPAEEYYGGHGSGETGWGPIMGVGYYQNLTQWSKGEYASANNTEDDLAIIVNNNNNVEIRTGDVGATLEQAAYLEILPNNTVANEGIIETRTDVDGFRFTTSGGAVALTAAVVNAGPNVDLAAEIFNSADVRVASSNPDGQINATVNATLAAGDYTLRVSGVGRGTPQGDGYSDYASLGAYLITGTVAGGVKSDRFSIAENSANGTAVGSVLARRNHGANELGYTFASGNTNGAFAIDASTGAITVANMGALNFETLSTRWDDPATFELFVAIADLVDPQLTENIRVVVTVSDVNEAPALTGGAVTMLEHTRTGTTIFKANGDDPDRYQFPTFSIVGGNPGGAFAINSLTGEITVSSDITAATQSTYTLSIQAIDQGTPARAATATVTITVLPIAPGYVPGAVLRTYFENITGEAVSNLTGSGKFPNNPDSEEILSAFDGGEHGDTYGSTVRGFLIPPVTGAYTFWIASDDSSELRLSTNATVGSAGIIASVSGATGQREWTRFPSQKSSVRTLQAGQPYYLEARQKEGGGGDHVAVAWQGPGFAQQVIPGLYLAPFSQNYAPKIPAATFSLRQNAFNGATVGTVQTTDANVQDVRSGFTILGGTGANRFSIDATTGRILLTNNTGLTAGGSFTLQVRTSDSGTPALTGSGTITINIVGADVINATGVFQEFWTNIGSDDVSALTADPRYPNAPSGTRALTSFDTGGDYADNYGSRIRGYVVPATSGAYTFYIASDDEGQLRLSRDANPANAAQIASVDTYTGRNNWTEFATQSSTARSLVAGQRYYIETLQKDGIGGDFVQVAWTGPGIATPTILAESVLDPFDSNVPPTWNGAPFSFATEEGAPNGTLVGTLSAIDAGGGAVAYAIIDGNAAGAFAVNGSTGAITVANSSALVPGKTVTLQVAAQDSGGGIYPLKTATTTAAITVIQDLRLLSPPAAIVNIPASVGLLLEATNDGKSGTAITWLKASGPGDVVFDQPNALATGATFSTAGSYVLRCVEVNGANTTSFTVTVNVGGTPGYALSGAKVGAQSVAPSHTVSAGVYQIDAAGNGIPSGATPDDFYFVQLPTAGNVSITARIVSVAAVNGSSSRAGVMIRESLAADARSAFCGITSQNGARFIYRATAATNTENAAATGAQPYWVRLTRTGNAFTAQIAPDSNGAPGAFSALGAAQTIAMSSNALVGLAASSGAVNTLGRTVIDQVTITPAPVNVGPNVDAGPDANLAATVSTTLNGVVSDDGNPAPPNLTTIWSQRSGPGSVNFSNPSAPETTATFRAAGSHVLRLTASDGHTKTFSDVILTVPLSIALWREQHFGASSGDETIAGNLADPDADGRSNLLEYAVASDPLAPSSGGITMDAEAIGADRFLRLTIAKNPFVSDITLRIEVTGDLSDPASWSPENTTIELENAETLQVRDNTPIDSATQRQIRLKVTQP